MEHYYEVQLECYKNEISQMSLGELFIEQESFANANNSYPEENPPEFVNAVCDLFNIAIKIKQGRQ